MGSLGSVHRAPIALKQPPEIGPRLQPGVLPCSLVAIQPCRCADDAAGRLQRMLPESSVCWASRADEPGTIAE